MGFLNGLICGRKELKMDLKRDDTRKQQGLQFSQTEQLTENIRVENPATLKVYTEVPKLFKIPFWLVSMQNDQKVDWPLILRLKSAAVQTGRD